MNFIIHVSQTRQLEALVLSVKQQKLQNQARLAKTAEQERSALRREIEALHTQLHNKVMYCTRTLDILMCTGIQADQ